MEAPRLYSQREPVSQAVQDMSISVIWPKDGEPAIAQVRADKLQELLDRVAALELQVEWARRALAGKEIAAPSEDTAHLTIGGGVTPIRLPLTWGLREKHSK